MERAGFRTFDIQHICVKRLEASFHVVMAIPLKELKISNLFFISRCVGEIVATKPLYSKASRSPVKTEPVRKLKSGAR
jgi:hypothetical protein